MTDDHTTLQVVPDGILAKGTTWADMMKLIDPASPCFIFFTLNFTTDDGLNKEEKWLVMFTPESITTELKMVYALLLPKLKAKCNKLQYLEIHGIDDLDEESIIAKS